MTNINTASAAACAVLPLSSSCTIDIAATFELAVYIKTSADIVTMEFRKKYIKFSKTAGKQSGIVTFLRIDALFIPIDLATISNSLSTFLIAVVAVINATEKK